MANRLCLLFLSSFASAVSFPKMLTERLLPVPPTIDRVAWQDQETVYHNLKNFTTETLRADCQWWSKCLSFILYIQLILFTIAFVL